MRPTSPAPTFSIRLLTGLRRCLLLASMAALPGGSVAAQTAGEYDVYPIPVKSPNHTTPVPPADARMVVVAPADPAASPFGWHDTDGMAGAEATTLEGNNARVFTDEMPPIPAPDCGADLECLFPLDLTMAPVTYSAASQTQVFYWLDYFHDVTFDHGFDSAAGNFQVNPYGGGGAGGDRLEARLRYDLNCNLTVSVPPDGASAMLQLSPCTFGGVTRDPALDADAVLHLAGHGLAARLVGGPSNTSCTSNLQAPIEGWADFVSMITAMQPGDEIARPYGTYFAGQAPDGPGIRSQPYSRNAAINTMSYGDIAVAGNPFAVGEVWAQTLWEILWELIAVHGFHPDLGDASVAAGSQRTLSYVVEGLKLTPCSPTFLDARDGVLAAATVLHDGEDVCRLWKVFAGMGMGTDAVAGSPNSTAVTEGFGLPAACTEIFSDGFESGDCEAWRFASPGC